MPSPKQGSAWTITLQQPLAEAGISAGEGVALTEAGTQYTCHLPGSELGDISFPF